MAERRLRYPLLWLLFAAAMVTGAGLLLSPDRARQAAGLLVLAAPLLAFGAMAAGYYLRERVRAGRP